MKKIFSNFIIIFLFSSSYAQLDSVKLNEIYKKHYLGDDKFPGEYIFEYVPDTRKIFCNPENILYIKNEKIKEPLGQEGDPEYSYVSTVFYEDLIKCKNLMFLDLKEGYFPPSASFKYFPNIREINIKDGTLTEKQIIELSKVASKLEGLTMRYEGKLPECFCELKNLRYLIINGPEYSLPTCISSMKKLKYLEVNANDTTILKSVFNMPFLESMKIDLWSNTKIPKTINNMKSLKSLQIIWHENSLKLPSEIGDLDSLEMLEIIGPESENEMEENVGQVNGTNILSFPKEFGKLKNLRGITIDKIPTLSNFPELTNAKKLLTFQFSNITTIKNNNLNFSGLNQLRNITLHGNGFSKYSSLPIGLETVDSLCILDIESWGNLLRLPSYFGKFQNFQFLKFNSSKIPLEDFKILNANKNFRGLTSLDCCDDNIIKLQNLFKGKIVLGFNESDYLDNDDYLLAPIDYYSIYQLTNSRIKLQRGY
jgi:hypothetical protein